MALLTTLLTGCENREDVKMSNTVRFVDTQQVMIDSGLAKQEAERLQAVQSKLKEGLALAETQYASMDKTKRTQAEQTDRQVLELYWQAEQQSARHVVNAAILKVIGNWQQQHHIDVILPRQSALALATGVDITAEITRELNSQTLVFSPLPEVSIKKTATKEADTVTNGNTNG